MSIVIVHGTVGSGKTTKAYELAGYDCIYYDDNTSSGDLLTKKTILVDDVETLKKDTLKTILKYAKGDVVLTTSDLNSIDKSIKSKAQKVSTGKIDRRKNDIIDQNPNSSTSCVYDSNIFKVLETVYSHPDRHFVCEMLNSIKPNVYGLLLWMLENGDLELLQYIDREQLFKMKPKFIYSTIAYGITPRKRRVNWPRKSTSKKMDDEVKKHFKLRASDMSILGELLEIPKVKKPKAKKAKKKVVKPVKKKTGFDAW